MMAHHFQTQQGGCKAKGKGLKGKSKGKGKNEDGLGGVCSDFNTTGTCPRGTNCRFAHAVVHPVATQRVDGDDIGRHCEVPDAHSGVISAITMTEQGIYTASMDKSLKRWKPTKSQAGNFELVPELTVQLPDACSSLLYNGGWLFCGLLSGQIRAYSQDGAEMTLEGHTRRVTAMKIHQSILISGSADREVRLWQMDPAIKAFKCTHTLKDGMPGAITRLHILGDKLWVGGYNGVAMCNLTSLTVTKPVQTTKPVADFLEFQGHLIVAYTDGSIVIFTADGARQSEMKLAAGPILAIAGLDSGPHLLCGHSRGQVSTITLPDFKFKTQFQAFEGTKVESLCCAGHDGIFLVGAQNGALQLWQRVVV